MPSLAPSLNLLLGGSLSIHQNNDVGAPQLPTKVEAEALFQRYAEAVSPLAHVLHTPSFKRLFDRFWLNIEMGSPNQNSCTALILAVCMAAAASVSPLQAKSQFGITKEDLFLRLQKATERALLRANWAKTSNIRTLQALTIYLVNITARYRHKQIQMLMIIDPSLSRPNFARHFCCRGCPCAPCPMHRNHFNGTSALSCGIKSASWTLRPPKLKGRIHLYAPTTLTSRFRSMWMTMCLSSVVKVGSRSREILMVLLM
jgi:hypothetical protein